MKVCLYGELSAVLKGSGIGTAIDHQNKALTLNGVEITRGHRDKYDIIDINTIGPRSAYVAHKMRWKNIPVVIHTHTTVEDVKDSFRYSTKIAPKMRGYLKYFYDQADLLISPSEYTKGVLRAYGIQADIEVISNGVDTDRFQPGAGEHIQFRERHEFQGLVPFCVGHVFKRKGILDFMDMARHFPENKFMWVGRIYQDLVDKEVKKAVDRKPENLLLTGYVKDVTSAYCAGDIFVFPSFCENQGISILEAAACMKPLIVRDLPAYHGWLEHGVNCLKAKDGQEFKTHLATLMGDKHLRDKLAKKAYETAQKHSLEIVGKKLKKAYETLL